MRRKPAVVLALMLAFAAPATAADSVDDVAREYVNLAMSARALDPRLVAVNDSRVRAQPDAASSGRDAAAIARRLGRLVERLDQLGPGRQPLDAMRWRSLRAHVDSLRFQLQPVKSLPVVDEVARRFGFVPKFPSLAEYDAAIDRLAAVMPGEGDVSARIAAMKQAATVPSDRIEAVMRAALAECRKRTAAHLALPAESIELRIVDDPVFPGSATYLGEGHSRVTISRTTPLHVDQALVLACHEVYPGHHTHYVSLDRALYKHRGWPEFAVELESGPLVPVAEAVAEYGVGLAFPVDERIAFERDVLFPIAGLTMADAGQWRAYMLARSDVLGASAVVARDYLSGAIDREEARRRFIRYRLQAPEAADNLLAVLGSMGSYLIASDLGWYTIDRMMHGRPLEEQWRLLGRIESEPMLLEDLDALRHSRMARVPQGRRDARHVAR